MPGEHKLPEDVQAYARTDLFTAQTVPDTLLRAHSLKAGRWGLLTVKAGTVHYFCDGQTEPVAAVPAGASFVIPPQDMHYVRLSDDAQFFVTFHRRITADS